MDSVKDDENVRPRVTATPSLHPFLPGDSSSCVRCGEQQGAACHDGDAYEAIVNSWLDIPDGHCIHAPAHPQSATLIDLESSLLTPIQETS